MTSNERLTSLSLDEDIYVKLKMYCIKNKTNMKKVLSEKITKFVEKLKTD